MTQISSAWPTVLLASHHASRRGSAISLIELGMRLPQVGYLPIYLFSKEGPLAVEMLQQGYGVFYAKREGFLRWPLLRRICRILLEENIALVHVNSAVPFSKYVALAAKMQKIPVVWHIREPVEDKRMRRQRPWVRLLADKIIVLTRSQEDFFSCPQKTIRIFNGVDVSRFTFEVNHAAAKRSLGYQESEFLFIQIGTIEYNKGQSRAIAAFREIFPRHPQARLLFLGDTLEAEEAQRMECLRSEPESSPYVRVLPSVADIRPYLAAADCLLLPSLRESFPRTVLEAMATGVPVIATRTGALPDMIREGETGWLIEAGEVHALAGAMEKAISVLQNERFDWARRCREHALANFTIDAHVTAVANVYRCLLTENQSG